MPMRRFRSVPSDQGGNQDCTRNEVNILIHIRVLDKDVQSQANVDEQVTAASCDKPSGSWGENDGNLFERILAQSVHIKFTVGSQKRDARE